MCLKVLSVVEQLIQQQKDFAFLILLTKFDFTVVDGFSVHMYSSLPVRNMRTRRKGLAVFSHPIYQLVLKKKKY